MNKTDGHNTYLSDTYVLAIAKNKARLPPTAQTLYFSTCTKVCSNMLIATIKAIIQLPVGLPVEFTNNILTLFTPHTLIRAF